MDTITATHNGWTATYSGGCYVDLRLGGRIVENINILDYRTGEYTMEPTQQALARELREWLADHADSLDGYREFYSYQ